MKKLLALALVFCTAIFAATEGFSQANIATPATTAPVTAGTARQSIEVPLISNGGQEIGTVTINGTEVGVVARVIIKPAGLKPGWHGIHFHETGDCSQPENFANAKSHLEHGKYQHGLLNPSGPDNGDLPNIFANIDGSVNAELFSPFVKMSELLDEDASAIIIHDNEDDHISQPAGNAGNRIVCGSIK